MIPEFTAASIGLLASIIESKMPGKSYSGVLPELNEQEIKIKKNLEKHINKLAGEIGERNIWNYAGLNESADYIKSFLAQLNYTVTEQCFKVEGKIVKNIEIELTGTSHPKEIIIIGAHYDSVLGTVGANDNGSGIAAMLEIARLFSKKRTQRTIRFVAFVNEEQPFFQTDNMGSYIYAQRSRERKENIAGMFSLETIGYYSDAKGSQKHPFPLNFLFPETGNFIAFVSNLASKKFLGKCISSFRKQTRFPSEGVAAPQFISGIAWSDQWAFWKMGFPAIMVTDTAPYRYPYYHTPDDTPDKINYDRFARVVSGLSKVIKEI